jgi:hypothetical protein
MTARKRETGRHVIEITPDLLGSPRMQRRHRQQRGEHRTDKSSSSLHDNLLDSSLTILSVCPD